MPENRLGLISTHGYWCISGPDPKPGWSDDGPFLYAGNDVKELGLERDWEHYTIVTADGQELTLTSAQQTLMRWWEERYGTEDKR